jgi:hypothetical protein
MSGCVHCSNPASKTVQTYWNCEIPVCDEGYARFERIRNALEGNTRRILNTSHAGQHDVALQELRRILNEHRAQDDFGWLRRNVLMLEASVHEDAGQYALAIQKLHEVRDLVGQNLSAFVQNQISLALDLARLDRDADALRELDQALTRSEPTEGEGPTPLDIQAVFVHYARISQRLGGDIPGIHRELFVRTVQNLDVPRDVWQREASLVSMVLKTEEWLDQQSRQVIANSKDPLFRPNS